MTDVNEIRNEILQISGVNVHKCMHCGKCSATCPCYDEMEYHPHQFVSMVDSGDIMPLLPSPSLYRCLSCFDCVERCPRQVEPEKLVEAVRMVVERERGGSHLPPDRIPGMLDENMPQQALVSALRKYNK